MGGRSVRRALEVAAKERRYVRVVRSITKATRVQGFVVGVGPKWVCLFQSVDGHPDGWVWVRLADVTDVITLPRRYDRLTA